MSAIGKRGLLLSIGFVALIAAAAGALVSFNGAAARGVALGVALGIVNLVAGLLVTRRSLDSGIKSVTGMITLGFGIRLIVIVTLFMIFRHSSTISASAMGLTFVAFFFVYLAAEIVMVERHRSLGHA